MQTEQDLARNVMAKRGCDICAHIRVCAVFRAIAPLMESFTKETKPFDASELAGICGAFLPAGAVKVLMEGE